MRLLFFAGLLLVAYHQPPALNRRARVLGTVTDAHGHVLYHVETRSWKVQAALTRHGRSAVLFYNPQRQLVAQYAVGMPHELPTKLVNNTLIFPKAVNDFWTQRLGAALPSRLCVGPGECYDRE